MIGFWKFLAALPALFRLFGVLERRIREADTNRKVSEDVKKIHDAFEAKDATLLDHLFNSD